MYHWIYLSSTEYDGVGAADLKTYTAPAPNIQAVPEVGDVLVFCEKVPAVYSQGREMNYSVASVTWYDSPNGSNPAGVRWTAALAA